MTLLNASHVLFELISRFFYSIQPPGVIHQVYTVYHTIMPGGHFLLMDTMHLTEWSRLTSVATKSAATNAEHPGFLRNMARMLIALVVRREQTGEHLHCSILFPHCSIFFLCCSISFLFCSISFLFYSISISLTLLCSTQARVPCLRSTALLPQDPLEDRLRL